MKEMLLKIRDLLRYARKQEGIDEFLKELRIYYSHMNELGCNIERMVVPYEIFELIKDRDLSGLPRIIIVKDEKRDSVTIEGTGKVRIPFSGKK